MNGRHIRARSRLQHFVSLWRAAGWPNRVHSLNGQDLLLTDLETLIEPRQVVRTIEQLQALPVGTIIVVQGDRAAQIEHRDEWDLDTGAEIESKRLIYAGTDLDDVILPNPLDLATRDTLRRMLPATVIETKEA